MYWKWGFRLLIGFLGLWLLLDLGSRLGAEIFWFREVGYLQVFLLRLVTRGILWVVVAGITAAYLLLNLALGQRLKYSQSLKIEQAELNSELTNFLSPNYPRRDETQILAPQRFQALKLRWLLPLTLILSLLIGLMLAHYGQIALFYWHSPVNQAILPIPALFRPETIWQLLRQIVSQIWYLGLIGGVAIAILIYPQFLLTAIAILSSPIFAFIIFRHWPKVLQYLHPTLFNSTEPLFGRDISFYVFSLPFWELLELWLMGLCLYGFVAVTLTYLLSADSLSQGIFPGFSPQQQRHLFGMGGLLMLVVALSYGLSRYELVYSSRGVSYGASYTDVTAQLPAYTVLCIVAVAIAFYLLWRTFFWKPKSRYRRFVFYGLGVYLVLVVAADVVLPTVVQYLIVQPNELQREQPYIQRTIALTRQAFDLEAIDVRTFNPQGTLTEADIQKNDSTIRNIRLWDQRPLLETNRQLQQIRPYYRFPDADIDRYTLKTDATSRRPSQKLPEPKQEAVESTERRQVLIAARELDYTGVPQEAQTWVNRHLIYTHGFGFTVSPVNTVGAGGLPEYFVKDISGDSSALTTSSKAIRESIPIGQPRIYYGEIANAYVMTGTRVRELDYPSGSDNVYNSYDGLGGVEIGSAWRRWLFATYLKDWQMVLTRDFLPETRVLLRRNVKERIQAIAPFLKFDSDPYLVATTANQDFPSNPSYLYWIVDAYTTSDRYPYSDTGSDGINYIRNSIKVVIDAYNGSVNFYIADPNDPIIATWSKIFPNTFKPLNTMPVTLRSHIRYPVDFFKIQSERLMTYHMTDAQVFYNREDQWQIPNEIYGTEPRPVEPYYLITSLPTVDFEEFLLFLPYTPRQRTNLIAWLAARSDGKNYGKLVLYVFPKERLIYGTEQIEARINQDPVISQQISLWNRQGSRAIQGNLLVIPIEQSLLYVEPIYLEATQNSLPTLVRVVVAYENRIVMAQTLEQALQGIFKPEVTPAPAIIRPFEEAVPPG
ncbi:hypothetical protein CDG76_12405 [Nostoc sp. 'Peltigera membranacea cyanobiont' 210A]|uniref:UPF0182 family protein n=1 Tax=Nostoc sp. 'Peltigera membranacea cyanobiont' 210A TaxID=2014529 RepID=UPI000B953994|nr:UPF0182 family protein [Nostoc sp. 'Peltigera membranacea cyanobiont' 210A]OYD95727.1 hypothetical protein CDG76_12405 [Nostoc sp. 'Peltigera membranacea cyanobiont' 210A]